MLTDETLGRCLGRREGGDMCPQSVLFPPVTRCWRAAFREQRSRPDPVIYSWMNLCLLTDRSWSLINLTLFPIPLFLPGTALLFQPRSAVCRHAWLTDTCARAGKRCCHSRVDTDAPSSHGFSVAVGSCTGQVQKKKRHGGRKVWHHLFSSQRSASSYVAHWRMMRSHLSTSKTAD